MGDTGCRGAYRALIGVEMLAVVSGSLVEGPLVLQATVVSPLVFGQRDVLHFGNHSSGSWHLLLCCSSLLPFLLLVSLCPCWHHVPEKWKGAREDL